VAHLTKHSHSIVLIHRGGNRGILVRVSLKQLSFHKIPIRKCTINVEVKCAMQDPIEGYAIGACLAQRKES
jgi:hypothetical protein